MKLLQKAVDEGCTEAGSAACVRLVLAAQLGFLLGNPGFDGQRHVNNGSASKTRPKPQGYQVATQCHGLRSAGFPSEALVLEFRTKICPATVLLFILARSPS